MLMLNHPLPQTHCSSSVGMYQKVRTNCHVHIANSNWVCLVGSFQIWRMSCGTIHGQHSKQTGKRSSAYLE